MVDTVDTHTHTLAIYIRVLCSEEIPSKMGSQRKIIYLIPAKEKNKTHKINPFILVSMNEKYVCYIFCVSMEYGLFLSQLCFGPHFFDDRMFYFRKVYAVN